MLHEIGQRIMQNLFSVDFFIRIAYKNSRKIAHCILFKCLNAVL